MPVHILDIIQDFAKNVRELLGDSLDSVIVYGSYARGDYSELSDVDVIILVSLTENQIKEIFNRISDLAFEYLMEYGEGQLCFTTHNVGPMDILKQRKKSIDFLSENHKIYSWKTNGNYSPSRLYRNGMIEGSPFNVDSIDFIGVFGSGGEDE